MNNNQNLTCDGDASSEECRNAWDEFCSSSNGTQYTDEELNSMCDAAEKQEKELKKSTFIESMNEWWNSDACKKLQKENEEAKQRAIGKYFMLSEEDKLDMVQAICFILYDAEKSGTSHRGLMGALGIYPSGFWVSELIDVHNALYEYYHNKKQQKELNDDLDSFENYIKND